MNHFSQFRPNIPTLEPDFDRKEIELDPQISPAFIPHQGQQMGEHLVFRSVGTTNKRIVSSRKERSRARRSQEMDENPELQTGGEAIVVRFSTLRRSAKKKRKRKKKRRKK